jgi:predicted metal-dependent peptidase
MEAIMANDTGTVEAVKAKGEYKHPDFPDRDLARLEKDAAAFNLDDHLVALLFREPFYADIIRSLHKERTMAVSTAGVLFKDDIMRFWWNPLFVAAYDPAVVCGILKHEALHLALEHTTTRRYNPHQVWNIAADLAINSTLTEEEMPPCGFRPGKKFSIPADFAEWTPEQQDRHLKLSALIESLPLHLTSEEYFTKLMESDVVQEMLKAGDGEPGDGMPEGQDDHSGWDELSNEEREYVAGKIRQAVKDAQERADAKNAWGSVSATMREEIRKKVRGEIDWKAVLRHFVGTTSRADRLSSVYRMNRKYAGIHPGHSRDYRPTLNCYIDQSGSMSDDDIILCFGELANLSHRVDINVFHFDTEVDESSKQTWRKGQAIPKALRTRCGGTDFDAPTKHAAKTKPEGYIILTDGGAPKPEHSRIRRCWVLVPGQELAFTDADSRDVVVKMKKPIKGIDNR